MDKQTGWMPPEQYYASLPRKFMGAGVLLFDETGQLMLVKPTYKSHWEFIGGVVDQNESPHAAVLRETFEEISLKLETIRLVCVHYRRPQTSPMESLQFMFHGGVLTPAQIGGIVLQTSELEDFRFVSQAKAVPLLPDVLKERLAASLRAIEQNTAVYIET